MARNPILSALGSLGRALGLAPVAGGAPYRAAPDRRMADAFGGSFELPPNMRLMTAEQLATSDLTRKQVRMAQGIQDYMNALDGKAVPVRTYLPTQALFTQWKRGPGDMTEGHFKGPGASIPSLIAATTNTGVSAVLTSTRPTLNVSMRVVDEGTMADRLGATRMPAQPPARPLSPVRLRPAIQRNTPVLTGADIIAQARANRGQDPRGDRAEQIQHAIGRTIARTKGY